MLFCIENILILIIIFFNIENRGYPGANIPPNSAGSQDMYNRYVGGQQGPGGYPPGATPGGRNSNYPSPTPGHVNPPQPPSTSQPSSPSQSPANPTYSCPQDYYRQEQVKFKKLLIKNFLEVYLMGCNFVLN